MTEIRSATTDVAEEQLVATPAPPAVWSDPFLSPPGTPTPLDRSDLPAPPPGRLRRVWRGRPADPAWVRPALLGLLTGTAVLYLYGLGASGWANSFYSAAVQAGTKSWKAFFFGSFDASNFITVDKPPGALWIMELSARVFGVNAWSILVPQALEGVATVGLLYLCVRRWFAPAAALLAGAVMALTPVATLMFRFNNPDALLTLLLTGAAYATIRAVEDGRTRWMVLAGSLIGFGFITKMLQALILLPVLALVYLLAGPRGLGRRILQVGGSGLAMLVSAGWWVVAVVLTPAADRPYVGGSTDNNLLNLIFGYNGFGRLTGNETGSVVPGGARGALGAASPWGPTGWDRLFLSDMGGQIAWLIPAALVATLAVLWFQRRAPRTDRVRAAFLLFGGWLLLTGSVLSFAQGIIHPYYTVVLAPAIGGLVGMGGWFLWTHRSRLLARLAIGVGLAVTVVWGFVLLDRTPSWYPVLRWAILLAGLATAIGIVLAPRLRGWRAAALAGLAIASLLAGPGAYSLETAATPHSGAIPSAGPTIRQVASGPGGPGGFAGLGGGGGPNGFAAPGRFGGGAPGGGVPFGGTGTFPGASQGTFGGTGGTGGFGNAGGGGRPSTGGLLNGSTPGKQLTALLEAGASRYTWVAATTGADSASGYQLATGDPVMAIGGFNGTDPAPTLAEFERDVAEGKIHYYIEGGAGGGMGGNSASSDASQIASWVSSHFTARTVDGITIYQLTRGT